MKIAIPITKNLLALHFGHSEKFCIATIENNEVLTKEEKIPPRHEPGILPKWLGEMGVNVILAGGMGQRAQNLFAEQNIAVKVGIAQKDADQLIKDYLSDSIKDGQNLCDH